MANVGQRKVKDMNYKNVVVTLLVSFVVLVGMSYLLFNGSETNSEGQLQIVEGVAGEERHVRDSGDIVIVEFSDFQCPACKSAQSYVDDLMQRYDGRVRLVYRHLPLTSIHRYAKEAALAAEAADRQGKFFEYHDLLFANQAEWTQGDVEEYFGQYASDLGMDREQFIKDYNSQEIKDIVDKDILYANQLGLNSTPTFFVNGEKMSLNDVEAKIKSLE